MALFNTNNFWVLVSLNFFLMFVLFLHPKLCEASLGFCVLSLIRFRLTNGRKVELTNNK